jgi:hypothetical protein
LCAASEALRASLDGFLVASDLRNPVMVANFFEVAGLAKCVVGLVQFLWYDLSGLRLEALGGEPNEVFADLLSLALVADVETLLMLFFGQYAVLVVVKTHRLIVAIFLVMLLAKVVVVYLVNDEIAFAVRAVIFHRPKHRSGLNIDNGWFFTIVAPRNATLCVFNRHSYF